ncbi:MAG: O-antigen ligase family protein [Paracoccaceae bacterium]|nr:O-antigen ligase family protein [Paracoccaceae bacterium]
MWLAVSSGITACTLLLLVRACARFRGDPFTQFLLFAIWFRYVLAAFHEITFQPMLGGFSINAVAAIGVGTVGVCSIPMQYFRFRQLSVLYLLIILVCISGVLNKQFNGLIFVNIKWLYFLAIFFLTYRAFGLYGRQAVFRGIFVCLTTPLLLQVASIALGHAKFAELDGSTAYIGGYFHEAVFSIVLVSAMWVSTMIRWRWELVGPALVLGTAVGLAFSSYRTNILASAPIILVYFFARGRDMNLSRKLIAVPMFLTAAFLVVEAGDILFARFTDILVVLGDPGALIKPPTYYTDAEKDIFSGRVYIWALYIHAFVKTDIARQLIGFGPESYESTMPIYAHNTFVSYLFEYGLIGVTLIGIWFIQNLLYVARSDDQVIARGGAAGQLAFLLANLATMPLWQIEGLILYALLLATALSPSEAPAGYPEGSVRASASSPFPGSSGRARATRERGRRV